MTVAELIQALGNFEPTLPVCFPCCSEYNTLTADMLLVQTLQPPRNDGWVHDQRPDKPTMTWLVLPGN